jgi:hypothetical protein
VEKFAKDFFAPHRFKPRRNCPVKWRMYNCNASSAKIVPRGDAPKCLVGRRISRDRLGARCTTIFFLFCVQNLREQKVRSRSCSDRRDDSSAHFTRATDFQEQKFGRSATYLFAFPKCLTLPDTLPMRTEGPSVCPPEGRSFILSVCLEAIDRIRSSYFSCLSALSNRTGVSARRSTDSGHV